MTVTGRPYREFQYLENPRTEVKHILRPSDPVAKVVLDSFEQKGWWAQLKLNGTRSGVYVSPRQEVVGWNRHGELHKAWQFSDETSAIFRGLRWHNRRGRQWWVFDGELMHNKTRNIKNTHYLYDILVCNGVHLVRTTYAERYKILEGLFEKHEKRDGHWVLDPYTWLACNHTEGFFALFMKIAEMPEVEGLVLKNPHGMYYSSDARTWMVKVRRK